MPCPPDPSFSARRYGYSLLALITSHNSVPDGMEPIMMSALDNTLQA